MSTLTDTDVRRVARPLRDLVELVSANVYFAPEAHQRYAALGLDYAPGYFGSRGACLGHPSGDVVAAAFGVFKPAVIRVAVDEAWSKTTPESLLAAREEGAVASLTRIYGPTYAGIGVDGVRRATELLYRCADAATGEGRALFSGLRSLGRPGTLIGDLWRAADLVREHRGDSHIMAWASHGLDAIEATLTTELWWRLPIKSYVKTRGWSDVEIDTAAERLRADGIVHGDSFTPEGEHLRSEIEWATDRQERGIVEALGDDATELFRLLTPLGDAVVAAKGYPRDPRQMTRQ
jgi:hypothetical protein